MIFPSRCLIRTRIGTDEYGQEKYSPKMPEKCAVVRLKNIQQQTSVRADQAASRAYADEMVSVAMILFPVTTKLKVNDLVDIHGMTIRAKSFRPQYRASGTVDHLEFEFEAWV